MSLHRSDETPSIVSEHDDELTHPIEPRRFAQTWVRAVTGTSYVTMSHQELDEYLTSLTARLAVALHSSDLGTATAHEIGHDLVANHFTGPATLGRTVRVLGQTLLPALGCTAEVCSLHQEMPDRVASLQGALATGYAEALRSRTFAEQEDIRAAAISAHREAEQALRASEAKFRAVFAEAVSGMGIVTLAGEILEVNQAVLDMMGYSRTQLRSINVRELVHPDDDPETWETFDAVVAGERDHFRMEKRYFRADGSLLWADLVVSLIRDESGKPAYLVAMVEDITKRHELQTQLQHAALHDPLTNLPNRTLLSRRLTEAVASAPPHGRIGVCYLDLDGFKAINDTFGHHVGDRLLSAVAKRFDEHLSPSGHFVARMGGDEFVLLVENPRDAQEVTEVADNLLQALAAPFHFSDHQLSISASIGIVERAVAGSDPNDLVKDADLTLYRAKESGKNRWALYDAAHSAAQSARYSLSAQLPLALEERQFYVEYQPLIQLTDRAVIGLEALVRWRHPKLGIVRPDTFIGLAEETGLIVPLGRWILEEACIRAAQWRADFGDKAPVMSVNISVRQLQDPSLPTDVEEILARTGLPTSLLQLEVTESAVLSTTDRSLATLHKLAEMGIKIAIDDFGTGYCNLAYLRELPAHTLKIAGSFVEGLRSNSTSNQTDQRIVATLVTLAHTLGLDVIAEGIETQEQADRLREISCDIGQGWLFAKPLPPEKINTLLATT